MMGMTDQQPAHEPEEPTERDAADETTAAHAPEPDPEAHAGGPVPDPTLGE